MLAPMRLLVVLGVIIPACIRAGLIDRKTDEVFGRPDHNALDQIDHQGSTKHDQRHLVRNVDRLGGGNLLRELPIAIYETPPVAPIWYTDEMSYLKASPMSDNYLRMVDTLGGGNLLREPAGCGTGSLVTALSGAKPTGFARLNDNTMHSANLVGSANEPAMMNNLAGRQYSKLSNIPRKAFMEKFSKPDNGQRDVRKRNFDEIDNSGFNRFYKRFYPSAMYEKYMNNKDAN